ncbi:MAG: nucleotidyltransferase [Clostridiales bacterium]|jgi:NDP-sugar pyrophosphorylase family protein|nr:nucleotidyltransferase [Clostridiales bacterium]
MSKPVLVVMAAGLGSRYGGLKQIAPVDGDGHIIMDYAVFDAKQAGFETVICILAPGMEQDFLDIAGNRMGKRLDLRLTVQRLEDLPAGFTVPEGRAKPWGTAHAVLSAKGLVDGPFAVINADDYYGPESFRSIYGFLSAQTGNSHAMVGYKIENTLTENGHVARGVCKVSGGKLTEIVENTRIEKRDGGAESFLEDGTIVFLPDGTIVSMNLWGFGASMMEEAEKRFAGFLTEHLPKNPLKAEYFLPMVPNALMQEGKAEISVLETSEKWYGVTYAQDMPTVRAALAARREAGKYADMW